MVMNSKILEIKNLKKSFGDHTVIQDINFSIEKGEIVSIIGASGSGKSTFLRCINLLGAPDSGQILFHGKNIQDADFDLSKYRSKVTMVFQSFNLFKNLNVLENCKVPQEVVLGKSAQEAEKTALEYLGKVGMDKYINARPRQISGGQQQRVAIARALCMTPEVLLFDEPTSALDPYNRRIVINTIRGMEQTKIITSHDLDMIMDTCSRVILLSNGRINADGDAEEILSNKALLEANHMELPLSLQRR